MPRPSAATDGSTTIVDMLEELFGNYQAQLQMGLIALLFVMGALLWRMHRQVRTLARTSTMMGESLGTLENKVTFCDAAPAWTFGIGDLMKNLAQRGLLQRSDEVTQ